MREILFRGKRLDDGEWVEGDLVHHPGYEMLWNLKDACDPKLGFEVISKTVGQFTGRDGIDSKGKKAKIFENHFVECDDGFVRVVCWVQEEGCFKLRCPNSWVNGKYVYFDALYLNESTKLIVVGNVFDDNFDEHNLKLHKTIEESGY